MQKILYTKWVLIFCLPVVLYGCDPCLGTGFGACGAYFKFIIRDKITKHDVVQGTYSIYNIDSIRIIPVDGNNQYPIPVGISGNQLVSQGETPVDTLFLKLSQTDTDTLLMKYHFKKSYCCRGGRGYGTVTSIKFNGTNSIEENGAYVFEK